MYENYANNTYLNDIKKIYKSDFLIINNVNNVTISVNTFNTLNK